MNVWFVFGFKDIPLEKITISKGLIFDHKVDQYNQH